MTARCLSSNAPCDTYRATGIACTICKASYEAYINRIVAEAICNAIKLLTSHGYKVTLPGDNP